MATSFLARDQQVRPITDLVELSPSEITAVHLTRRNPNPKHGAWPLRLAVTNQADITSLCELLRTGTRVSPSHPEVEWECHALIEQQNRALNLNIALTIRTNTIVDVAQPWGPVQRYTSTYEIDGLGPFMVRLFDRASKR